MSNFIEPSSYVDAFHDLPHMDLDLRSYDGIFEAPLDDNGDLYESLDDYTYGQTLVVALSFMLAIGVGAFLVHLVWSFCCCCCCNGGGSKVDEFGQRVTWNSTRAAKLGTVIFSLIAIGAALYGFSTVADFNTAADRLTDADTTVRSLQSDALAVGDDLHDELEDGTAQVDIILEAVAGIPAIEAALEEFRAELVEADDTVTQFQTEVEDVELSEDIPDHIADAARVYQALTITIFVICIVIAVMTTINVFLSSKSFCMKAVLHWVGAFLMLVVWIAFSVEMVIAIMISDVCIDSDTVVLDTVAKVELPAGGEDIAVFYVGCEADPALDNPLQDTLTNITTQLMDAQVQANDTLVLLPPGNEDQADAIIESLSATIDSVGDLETVISCDSVNPVYQEVQIAACNDTIIALGNAVVSLGVVVFATFLAGLMVCKERPDPADQWNSQFVGVNAGNGRYKNLDAPGGDRSQTTAPPTGQGIDLAHSYSRNDY